MALAALGAVVLAACGGGGGGAGGADSTAALDRTTSTSVTTSTTGAESASTTTTLANGSPTSTTAAVAPPTSSPQTSAPTTSVVQGPSGVVTASDPEEVVWPETNACKAVGVTLRNQSTAPVSSVVVTFKLFYEPISGSYLFTRLLASEPLQMALGPGASVATDVQVCPVNADLTVGSGEQYRVDPTTLPTVTWTWAASP
ncbi:MAG: hypothetical protein ACT4OV_13715 [Microthrixaceae bacterium]